MGNMRKRLADEKVKNGVSEINSFHMERLNDWSNLLMAFGGLYGSGVRISQALTFAMLPGVDAEIPSAEILKPYPQLEKWLHKPRLIALGAHGNRLAGIRTTWEACDPEVLRFTSELSALRKVLPPPDEAIVKRLAQFGCLSRIGHIILVDGIPTPAGDEQIPVFVAIRWRWLIIPPHNLAGGFDFVNLSDESMEQLLAYTVKAHTRNLAALQQHHIELFCAVWRRDIIAVRKLLKKNGKELEGKLVPVDDRLDRIRSQTRYLLYGTAIMSELERLFEILECLHRKRSITRAMIDDLLKKSYSMADIHKDTSPAGLYLAGVPAQIRGSHPSMNRYYRCKSADQEFKKVNAAIKSTRSFFDNTTRLREPFEGKPALYFIGIEQQFIPLAAIIMLIDNINRIVPNFRRRGARGHSSARVAPNEAVKLAAVIAANVDPKWARALLDALGEPEEDDDWLAMGMPGRARRSAECEAGERNHFRVYQAVRSRVDKLPKVNAPGWTRGFYFEAWLRPTAEVSFLRKCCNFNRFSKVAQKAHKLRMKKVPKNPYRGSFSSVALPSTGLPNENPVEAAHERMRPFFEKLQYPHPIARRYKNPHKKTYKRALDVFVREAARVFPAVTPMTLDPNLSEQIRFSIDRNLREFAVEGLWHTTLI